MKRFLVGVLMLVALSAVGVLGGPQATRAQGTTSQNGWLEGVIVTESGEPAVANPPPYIEAAVITIRPKTGDGIKTYNDNEKGGFYTFRDLKPGIYEVFLDKTKLHHGSDDVHYRPQHIFGVVITPGERTVLNLTVHEGDALEEIGKPAVTSQPVIIISQELARLQKEIDALKKTASVPSKTATHKGASFKSGRGYKLAQLQKEFDQLKH